MVAYANVLPATPFVVGKIRPVPGHVRTVAAQLAVKFRHARIVGQACVLDNLAHPDDGDNQKNTPLMGYAPKDRKELWKAAIKLPMYSVAVVPVLVAAAAAYLEHGTLPWLRVAGLLAGSLCIVAWVNLSNDAFDATTGVDLHKPESVVSLTGNRTGVLLLSKLFLAAGIWLLKSSITAAQLEGADNRVTIMLAAAIAFGYLYQGPPFRLSYKGLGEPLCFCAFGPLDTIAFYLVCSACNQTGIPAAAVTYAVGSSPLLSGVSNLVLMLSAIVGISTSVILFCSHWHQIEGDIAGGKMSPLVRIGTAKACKVLLAATASPYVIALVAAALGVCPLPLLAALVVSLPAAGALVDFAYTNHTVPARIASLKRVALKWHVAVGACLTAGLFMCKVLKQ